MSGDAEAVPANPPAPPRTTKIHDVTASGDSPLRCACLDVVLGV